MKDTDKKTIGKLQATLAKIATGKKVFFNLADYRKLGLITERNIWGRDSTGRKVVVGTKYGLTEKGERILKVVI